jgi:hypothetical protein
MITIYEEYAERRSNFNSAQNQQPSRDKFERLAIHMRRNAPDKQFLLHLIMCINPGSHIFEPGFKPANTKNAKPEPAKVIPDREGILRNSAFLDTSRLGKRRSINMIPKKEQMKMKVQRALEKEQKATEYRLKLEADQEAYDSAEEGGATVKISMKDYQTLQRAKQLERANEQLQA